MPVPHSFILYSLVRPAVVGDFYMVCQQRHAHSGAGGKQTGSWTWIVYANDEAQAKTLAAAETMAPNGYDVGVRSITSYDTLTQVRASWLSSTRASLHQPYSGS